MRNLLAVTWERTQLHHFYPQEYRDKFATISIKVDQFIVSLTDETHRICTVCGEANGCKLGNWNDRWPELFFKTPLTVTVDKFSSLTGEQQKALSVLFGANFTPPSSFSNTDKK
ncbi:uncharacterized protein ATNIH1004_005307 [Aspergillus tanneri]|uniref:Uncharacterized protein n=1 Tax=Aspergillus tanneri TaxID=1220188 RepID=A0A5M9MTX5_9EURO|nr:uncharacterized protein ATNIH1004_005307 [Aspergillus tanneri]KAA8649406.1 hypothetical protein ATNIH1004_005307 [Aspergillus tanneri]